jgi:hypothetical protein
MEWEAYLVWLHLLTYTHCKQEEPQRDQGQCVELIKECMLDGEKFEFCKDNWRVGL